MILGFALGVLLQAGGGLPAVIERSTLDPRADVNFHAAIVPETVYVGAPATYELGVFIADEVRQRLRKNPEFIPPELRSVLAYDLHDSQGARTVVRDGRTYEVHVFRRALFPVAPGKIVIPPARLTYTMPLGASFFSREETHTLRSESVTIVAISPPASGRPPNWTGAVGDLQISTKTNARAARVGDPFLVTLRVSGSANVNLLPRPTFTLPWGTVVPSAERVTIDSLAASVRGAKEFDFLVTPSLDGLKDIPPVEYSFFDPSERRYRSARSSTVSVSIGEGSIVSFDSSSTGGLRRGALPLRNGWGPVLPDAPDRTLWYWIAMAIVPIPALRRIARERPKRRKLSVPGEALRSLADANGASLPQTRAALSAALATRLGRESLRWDDAAEFRKILRHRGVTDATADDLVTFVMELDRSVYGGASPPNINVPARALALYEKVDEEAVRVQRAARKSRRRRKAAKATAIIILAVAAGVGAAQSAAPREQFNKGLAEYAKGNAAVAASDFFGAAAGVPAAQSAWANAGTASWEAADTARAVVAWQRALRLDPLDDNVRDLLTLVGADAGASQRDVWPLPRRLLGWVALLLWGGGWLGVWRSRHPRVAMGAVAVGALVAVVSRVHYARLTDDRVVVVSKPAQLRSLPALGAEAGAMPLTGELLKVVERSGVWVRVAGQENRDGWIDAARVLDLNGRPLRN